MIQINERKGFSNFEGYQSRKEIFIEGETAYEDELVRIALNETLRKENIRSLEARICPKNILLIYIKHCIIMKEL